MFWNKRKSQTIFEYAMLIFLAGVALSGILYYFSHAFEGRVKEAADFIGDGDQYEPGETVDLIE